MFLEIVPPRYCLGWLGADEGYWMHASWTDPEPTCRVLYLGGDFRISGDTGATQAFLLPDEIPDEDVIRSMLRPKGKASVPEDSPLVTFATGGKLPTFPEEKLGAGQSYSSSWAVRIPEPVATSRDGRWVGRTLVTEIFPKDGEFSELVPWLVEHLRTAEVRFRRHVEHLHIADRLRQRADAIERRRGVPLRCEWPHVPPPWVELETVGGERVFVSCIDYDSCAGPPFG